MNQRKTPLFSSLFLSLGVILLFGTAAFSARGTNKSSVRNLSWEEKFPFEVPQRTPKNVSIAIRKGKVTKISLAEPLKSLPFMNDDVVLGTKTIHIPGVFAPYNASIAEHDEGYYLVFRYDLLPNVFTFRAFANIGLVDLDQNFNLKDEFIKLRTKSAFSEDPRLLRVENEYYLVYNDIVDDFQEDRVIHLANLNPETGRIGSNITIKPSLRKVEKNWSLFVYQEKDKTKRFCFEYQLCCPRQILKLKAPNDGEILEITTSELKARDLPWNCSKWGVPLGGTPARLVDGEYLAFFHSKFFDPTGVVWYVAGAYTFEAKPPFRMTSMSDAPIFFENIYDAPLLNTAETNKQVLFPAGYAIEQKRGKNLIHLSCGENDSSIKIVTLDKNALMKTLVKIP